MLALALTGVAGVDRRSRRARRYWPALTAAWFTYLVLLAPVMGLTPSGQTETRRPLHVSARSRAVDDLIGLAVAQVDRRNSAVAKRPSRSIAGVTLLLGGLTWRGVHWWHDSITLWTRALEFDARNDIATYNLAVALQADGRTDEAIARYEQTLDAHSGSRAGAPRPRQTSKRSRPGIRKGAGDLPGAASDLRFRAERAGPTISAWPRCFRFRWSQINRNGEAAAVLKDGDRAGIQRTTSSPTTWRGCSRLRAMPASEMAHSRCGWRSPFGTARAGAIRGYWTRSPRRIRRSRTAGRGAARGHGRADARATTRRSGIAAEIAAHPWSAATRDGKP